MQRFVDAAPRAGEAPPAGDAAQSAAEGDTTL
jgi:hypothetical protein